MHLSVLIPLYVFHLQFIEFELIYNLKGKGKLKMTKNNSNTKKRLSKTNFKIFGII